jgi:hypothetical protein
MADEMFTTDITSSLRGFRYFMQVAPREAKKGIAAVLNDLAFQDRDWSAYTIARTNKVRSRSFVSRQLWVSKANPTQLQAIMASIRIPGGGDKGAFTGWREQQFGGESKKRTDTLFSRGGSETGTMKRQFRLIPSASFPMADNFTVQPEASMRLYAMLAILGRMNFKKPFLVGHGTRFHAGMFQLTGDRKQITNKYGKKIWISPMRKIQDFDMPMKPKRTNWAGISREHALAQNNASSLWAQQLAQLIAISKGK